MFIGKGHGVSADEASQQELANSFTDLVKADAPSEDAEEESEEGNKGRLSKREKKELKESAIRYILRHGVMQSSTGPVGGWTEMNNTRGSIAIGYGSGNASNRQGYWYVALVVTAEVNLLKLPT